MTSGGAGYDSAPTVAINDTVGTADKGASATATVAAKGAVTAVTVTTPGSGYLTPGLKKFVDTLPGSGPSEANKLGQYIPVAVPDTTTYPGSDYYEIAVVQYRQKFSSALPATLVRGYVQLSTSVVPGKQTPLSNANLNLTLPDSPVAGGYTGVDSPHYLGPTIVATKDKPTRILFRNLLPIGVAGDLFLPVDTSVMGSGPGPDMMTLGAGGVPNDMAPDQGTVTDGVRNPMCGETPKPAGCYTENRATLHLHGGVTPWISDGTPHQWTTPVGENTAYPKGVSVSNVPDMPNPGPGAETFFYTNQQSARLMFYHDHAWGITRLNVYAGEAAGYLLTDPMEKSLEAKGGALAGLGDGTPLLIQDKTFVPSAAQMAKVDPTWNAAKWGGEGSLWTPHVYMPAQNPGSASGSSPFGRWMYGPWFWPPAKDVRTDVGPVEQAAVAHAQFEIIHPFADGNGRIGRVLVYWLLTRRLRLLTPPPVSVRLAADVGGYTAGLTRYRIGQTSAWVAWFADAVCGAGREQQQLIAAVEQFRRDWQDRLAAHRGVRSVRSDASAWRVLALLPRHLVLTARLVADELTLTRKAAGDALHTLRACSACTPPRRGRSAAGPHSSTSARTCSDWSARARCGADAVHPASSRLLVLARPGMFVPVHMS